MRVPAYRQLLHWRLGAWTWRETCRLTGCITCAGTGDAVRNVAASIGGLYTSDCRSKRSRKTPIMRTAYFRAKVKIKIYKIWSTLCYGLLMKLVRHGLTPRRYSRIRIPIVYIIRAICQIQVLLRVQLCMLFSTTTMTPLTGNLRLGFGITQHTDHSIASTHHEYQLLSGVRFRAERFGRPFGRSKSGVKYRVSSVQWSAL